MAEARSDEAEAKRPRYETIEELFAALESPLLGYARRLAPNNDMAEDIVQEAFVKLHAQFRDVRTPRSWLYRTVHNLALNLRRQDNKIIPLPQSSGNDPDNDSELADTKPLPDEQIARWEGVGLVRLNLQNLDARSQEVIRLKFHENLSYKEIAGRTGLTTGNVGFILHHALKNLASGLARAGLTP